MVLVNVVAIFYLIFSSYCDIFSTVTETFISKSYKLIFFSLYACTRAHASVNLFFIDSSHNPMLFKLTLKLQLIDCYIKECNIPEFIYTDILGTLVKFIFVFVNSSGVIIIFHIIS